jgi:hypothetical protein
MFRFKTDYQMDLLNIACNNQHFEPIEYTCDVRNGQFQFEIKKIISYINLDDCSTILKLMKKNTTFAQKIHFH